MRRFDLDTFADRFVDLVEDKEWCRRLRALDEADRSIRPEEWASTYKTLSDLIAKEPPSLKWSPVYTELLRAAGPAGLSENDVRGYLDRWLAAAGTHGARLVDNVRTEAAIITARSVFFNIAISL